MPLQIQCKYEGTYGDGVIDFDNEGVIIDAQEDEETEERYGGSSASYHTNIV